MRFPDPFVSLGEVVADLGVHRPDDPAFASGGLRLTRGDVSAGAQVLAAGWRAAGYPAGAVIGVVGDGGLAFVWALVSAARAGLVPLLLDPRLTADETRHIVGRARPVALALCGSAPPVTGDTPSAFAFDDDGCATLRLLGERQPPPPIAETPHAPAVLVISSGTSGCPRVVALSAANLSANILSGYQAHVCERDAVFLSVLPATHAFEFTNGLVGPIRCGASVVFPSSRNPRRVVETAIAEHVTHLNLVPALLQMLVRELGETPGGDVVAGALRRQLRSIVCGGAPMAPGFVRALVDAGWPLWLGYGLTEASPSVAVGRADVLPAGSTGRALPGIDVAIDPARDELLVRGPNVMLGYLGDERATGEALTDGWLRTGDVARLDADGHLFIVGRLRDLIVTGAGLKVAPDDVEAAYRSPMFADVCAIGVPDDEIGGESPHLVVVPASGGSVDARAIRDEFQRLSVAAGARRARALTVVTSPLPRTRTLKLRRDLVRQLVLDRLEVLS